MLFPRATLDGIREGRITLAFRRWKRPRVRPGTKLRTAIGLVEVDGVTPVAGEQLTAEEARRAGATSLEALANGPRNAGEQLYRVDLHYAGADPRVAQSRDATLDAEARAAIERRLARLDAVSKHGPWTSEVLELIAANEGVVSTELAAKLGRERMAFKADVRKLKELGLTESLEVGYRISPRGRAYLEGLSR